MDAAMNCHRISQRERPTSTQHLSGIRQGWPGCCIPETTCWFPIILDIFCGWRIISRWRNCTSSHYPYILRFSIWWNFQRHFVYYSQTIWDDMMEKNMIPDSPQQCIWYEFGFLSIDTIHMAQVCHLNLFLSITVCKK